MSTFSRLTEVFNESEEILFDNTSRFIFFSDCHRGDNSKADDFAPNRDIYSSALKYYYANGYTYIEIGDGDELWENSRFTRLLKAHMDIYLLMQKFYREGRLYMIRGNHDNIKRYKIFLQKNMYEYYNPLTKKFEPLFDGIKVHEGLILKYKGTPSSIFVVHGHQGELMSDYLWPIACFVTRYIWRHIEALRRKNPFSPARNIEQAYRTQSNIIRWVRENNQMIITGHTHNYAFAKPGEVPYFNDGCCVYRGYITGIEITDGEIMLVKWTRKTGCNGLPVITREILEGPEKILSFLSSNAKASIHS